MEHPVYIFLNCLLDSDIPTAIKIILQNQSKCDIAKVVTNLE